MTLVENIKSTFNYWRNCW